MQHGFDPASQERLRVDEIAQLEYPGRVLSPNLEAWMLRMETAIEYGALRLPPGEKYDRFGGWPYITREGKYPPAEPGALVYEPLKAAKRGR